MDVPGVVEYVCDVTGWEKVDYVGYSQGTTSVFAALSLGEEVNGRVRGVYALAPSLRPRPTALADTPVKTILKVVGPTALYGMFGYGAFLPLTGVLKKSIPALAYAKLMDMSFWHLFGWSCGKLGSWDRKMAIYGHCFGGTSVRNLVQWFQVIDHGSSLLHYNPYFEGMSVFGVGPGKSTKHMPVSPVKYPTKTLFCGTADRCISDVDHLREHLPKGTEIIEIEDYGHLDFCWAVDAKEKCWDKMIDLMLARLPKEDLPASAASAASASSSSAAVERERCVKFAPGTKLDDGASDDEDEEEEGDDASVEFDRREFLSEDLDDSEVKTGGLGGMVTVHVSSSSSPSTHGSSIQNEILTEMNGSRKRTRQPRGTERSDSGFDEMHVLGDGGGVGEGEILRESKSFFIDDDDDDEGGDRDEEEWEEREQEEEGEKVRNGEEGEEGEEVFEDSSSGGSGSFEGGMWLNGRYVNRSERMAMVASVLGEEMAHFALSGHATSSSRRDGGEGGEDKEGEEGEDEEWVTDEEDEGEGLEERADIDKRKEKKKKFYVSIGNLLAVILLEQTMADYADYWTRSRFFYLVSGLCFGSAVFQYILSRFYTPKADRPTDMI
ncbi:cholesterol esterase [Phlyctochytrium planicorne]|nr:cholesterol esterase [Phlyctochytrium planicorne]